MEVRTTSGSFTFFLSGAACDLRAPAGRARQLLRRGAGAISAPLLQTAVGGTSTPLLRTVAALLALAARLTVDAVPPLALDLGLGCGAGACDTTVCDSLFASLCFDLFVPLRLPVFCTLAGPSASDTTLTSPSQHEWSFYFDFFDFVPLLLAFFFTLCDGVVTAAACGPPSTSSACDNCACDSASRLAPLVLELDFLAAFELQLPLPVVLDSLTDFNFS